MEDWGVSKSCKDGDELMAGVNSAKVLGMRRDGDTLGEEGGE